MTEPTLLALHRQKIVALEAEVARLRGIEARAKDGRVSVQRAYDAITRALTQDFDYGKRKDGTPLKRPKRNQALFRLPDGHAVFNGTDFAMVIAAVRVGLELAEEGE